MKAGELERIRTALDYDAETGIFSWRKPQRGRTSALSGKAGYRKATGYITITVHGAAYYAHRLAWIMVRDQIPDGMEIDHIDHDRSNNRIGNLRLVTTHDNRKNQTRSRRNKSGIPGVHWAQHANKWAAHIRVNRKSLNLGYFDDIEAAAAARKMAEQEHGFHNNHGKM